MYVETDKVFDEFNEKLWEVQGVAPLNSSFELVKLHLLDIRFLRVCDSSYNILPKYTVIRMDVFFNLFIIPRMQIVIKYRIHFSFHTS